MYLTTAEANELKDSLEQLLSSDQGQHFHIPDENYKKEVTICLYDSNNLEIFDERSKKLILPDE